MRGHSLARGEGAGPSSVGGRLKSQRARREGRGHRARVAKSISPAGPPGERREDAGVLEEAGVAGTAAPLRLASWPVDLPTEAPKREEGPKAVPQGKEAPALDVHL